MAKKFTAVKRTAPIGVFDSGLGGLTVLRQLIKLLPNESFIYLADNANAPYGDNPPQVVEHDMLNIIDFYLKEEVKMIVAACNTSSAVAFDAALERVGDKVPIIGVIDDGVNTAIRIRKNDSTANTIAVLATEATTNNGVFKREIIKKSKENNLPIPTIIEQACPPFVKLVEKGLWSGSQVEKIVEDCIGHLRDKNPNLTILGCTHYPLLSDAIKKSLPASQLIDCSAALAESVAQILKINDMVNTSNIDSSLRFYLTDKNVDLGQYRDMIELILHKKINSLDYIVIEKEI